MSEEEMTKEEPDGQSSQALSDPDVELPLNPPKESSEPGLPPPRD